MSEQEGIRTLIPHSEYIRLLKMAEELKALKEKRGHGCQCASNVKNDIEGSGLADLPQGLKGYKKDISMPVVQDIPPKEIVEDNDPAPSNSVKEICHSNAVSAKEKSLPEKPLIDSDFNKVTKEVTSIPKNFWYLGNASHILSDVQDDSEGYL